MSEMTEDRLVQQTTADYMRDKLGWESVFAFNEEVLGQNGTLGRMAETEMVLTRHLRAALEKLNPGLPEDAYQAAIRQILEVNVAKSTLQTNCEKYSLFKKGVLVAYRNAKNEREEKRLRVFNFEDPTENHFLVVRELWIKGALYRRRPDIVGFVNGIPLLFFELKNIHKDIRRAYNENLSDYKDTIPHVFHHNAIVVLANGDKAKVGSFSSKYEHFHEWKRLEEDGPGVVDMETLLKGMCSKKNFMDIFENYIAFDESTGKLAKILARNHQFLGVNKAVEAVRDRKMRQGKLGVFWHTQGSGKSYSMVFFCEKVRRKLAGDFTFLILTDREDLDDQIYKTYAGCGVVDQQRDDCRAASGKHLKELLTQNKPYVFSMIHKFNQDVDPKEPYSFRDDVIVISDEAHRTQYGRLALNLRNALPKANYIGFTGTPLFSNDEITRRIFGEYISTYDFDRAVKDNATVPLYYDNRGEKLNLTTSDINEKIAAKLEELELDPNQQARLEAELQREYHIITAGKRLDAIAADLVRHYTTQWESGKAMLVCIDKITTVRMYDLIQGYWKDAIKAAEKELLKTEDEQQDVYLRRKLEWLKSTQIAVIISEEQGEVDLFRQWDLDVTLHRKRIKDGFELSDGKTIGVDIAFKDPAHPFRLAIVCAMWMTGFDVPSLATLYLDKPMKAHTLMQAIARANRVSEGKNNGLIVDYCGILKNLREALATFASGGPVEGGEGPDGPIGPIEPEEDLLESLREAIDLVKAYLKERSFDLKDIISSMGFDRNAAIARAKEVINQSEETRKRFEIIAREVFKKFKACLTMPGINDFMKDHDAISIIYKKLQDDRDSADITAIMRELHSIVDRAVEPNATKEQDFDGKLYDISKIDFERLKEEFKKWPRKNTMTQCLKNAVEERLQRMIAKNPLRADFYKRYQEIIKDYNFEKDRLTIEQTFAALLKLVESLDEEGRRNVKEGLDEEQLALFDLLCKPELTPRDRNRIKKVAQDLLNVLKREKLRVDRWREKDSTRAEVKVFIRDFLWDEKTGLPETIYKPEDVEQKAESVYQHIFMQYADAEHNAYTGT